MNTLLALAIIIACAALGVVFWDRTVRARRVRPSSALARTVSRLGLQVDPLRSSTTRLVATSPDEPLTVTIDRSDRDDMGDLRAEISGGLSLPLRIQRGRRTMSRADSIPTGDDNFDAAFVVTGHEVMALAFLTAKNREVLTELMGLSDMISGPRLSCHERRLSDGIRELLEVMVATVRDLAAARTNLRARLLDNTRADPVAEARSMNQRVLLENFSQSREAGEIAEDALKAEDVDVRIAAAAAMNERGFDILRDIALGEGSSSAARARALYQLARRFAAERTSPILYALAEDPKLNAEVRAAVAEAFGTVGELGAESILIEWLEVDTAEVRAAATEALGQVGSLAAIEPLLWMSQGGSRVSALTRRTAISALSRIQHRMARRRRGR